VNFTKFKYRYFRPLNTNISTIVIGPTMFLSNSSTQSTSMNLFFNACPFINTTSLLVNNRKRIESFWTKCIFLNLFKFKLKDFSIFKMKIIAQICNKP